MGHWCVILSSDVQVPSSLPHAMTINQMIRQRVYVLQWVKKVIQRYANCNGRKHGTTNIPARCTFPLECMLGMHCLQSWPTYITPGVHNSLCAPGHTYHLHTLWKLCQMHHFHAFALPFRCAVTAMAHDGELWYIGEVEYNPHHCEVRWWWCLTTYTMLSLIVDWSISIRTNPPTDI